MKERFVTVSLSVKPGLHVLRYVSAADMKHPPRVLVQRKPGAGEGLELLFSPGVVDGALTGFEDMAVISASREGELLVTTLSGPLSISTDVELKLDPIGKLTGVQPASQDSDATQAMPGFPGSRYLQLAGHVQRLGDTLQHETGWLGAASGRARLEAFAASWIVCIKGVRRHYGCEIEGHGRQTARVHGDLVGTRGQSAAITGVFFELKGSQAGAWEFVATAAFAGCLPRTATGSRIELSGPTGGEPLVGLKIDVRPATAQAQPSAAPSETIPPLPERGRVRIFRATDRVKR